MDVTLKLGDCLDVMREMDDKSVDCIVTDPPYGIEYKHANGASAHSKNKSTTIVEWSKIDGDDDVDGTWLKESYRILSDSGAVYFVTRWDVEPKWRTAIGESGLLLKQRLTWHKKVHGKGDLKGTFSPSCEDILFATKGRHNLNSRPSMLLDVGSVPTWEYRYHPHQKPIELCELLIRVSTQEGDTVFDPFMGSGTTGVACVNLNRNFIGCEINPEYFNIAERRINNALALQGKADLIIAPNVTMAPLPNFGI